MKEPIDLEWLGCSWHRIDRLYAAEQAAIRAGGPAGQAAACQCRRAVRLQGRCVGGHG